jgi:hypothetical protein
MRCKIRIHYTTGDSFGTKETYTDLDGTWERMEVVEDNVNRIEEHHKYYLEGSRCLTEAGFKKLVDEIKDKSWYAPPLGGSMSDVFTAEGSFRSIKLVTDDGRDYRVGCFWIGYFETLDEVEAVIDLPKKKISSF